MSNSGNYDRRAPSASSQIITLERLLEEAETYNETLQAENAKLRMNLDAYKQAEELWCRQDEKREAENQRLKEVNEAAEKMITEGYADSFSNWVCPSEYAFPLEQALAAIGEG